MKDIPENIKDLKEEVSEIKANINTLKTNLHSIVKKIFVWFMQGSIDYSLAYQYLENLLGIAEQIKQNI